MSSIPGVYGLPGVRAPGSTAQHRIVFKGGRWDYVDLPGGRLIDGARARDPLNTGDTDVLRAGLLMGKVTASGMYGASVLGVTLNAEAIGSTAIEVSPATAAELVRRVGTTGTFKLTGPPTAAGTVATETVTYSAVNQTTGVITVTAIANAYVAGSLVQPTDGSEIPNTLIPDGWGKKVTDAAGASLTVPFEQLPIGGTILSASILNWPADTALRAWVTAQLKAAGAFVLDHVF